MFLVVNLVFKIDCWISMNIFVSFSKASYWVHHRWIPLVSNLCNYVCAVAYNLSLLLICSKPCNLAFLVFLKSVFCKALFVKLVVWNWSYASYVFRLDWSFNSSHWSVMLISCELSFIVVFLVVLAVSTVFIIYLTAIKIHSPLVYIQSLL